MTFDLSNELITGYMSCLNGFSELIIMPIMFS